MKSATLAVSHLSAFISYLVLLLCLMMEKMIKPVVVYFVFVQDKVKRYVEKKKEKMSSRWHRSLTAATVTWVILVEKAQAALPTVEDPSRGTGSGLLETAQNHMFDAFVFVGLVIAAVVFFVTAKSAIAAYNEIGEGRGSWSKLAITVVIGVILIVSVIWLVTKGSDVL